VLISTVVAGAPLGNITRFASLSTTEEREKHVLARFKRFALQSIARELLPDERVYWCLRRLGFDKHNVEVWIAELVHQAHLKNIIVCGSVWHCPVCAAKITERRRVEMSEALEKNRDEFTPVLVTLTFQHDRSDRLEDLITALAAAWRMFRSGAGWNSIVEEYGLVASVTGMETTWGRAAGWHPHKHALFFSSKKSIDVDELQRVLAERWKNVLARLSHYAHSDHGVDVRIGDDQAGDYVSKWGLEFELAKSPVKRGRSGKDGVKGYSPFELLELYGDGEKWAGALFQEYAAVMKGRKQLVWSRGARKLLGLDDIEATDVELAAAPAEQSFLFATLSWGQYTQIIRAADSDHRTVIGELLEVASKGDPVKFWAWLEQFGIFGTDDQRVQSEYPWLLPQNNGVDIHELQRRLDRIRAAEVENLRREKNSRKWKQRFFFDPEHST
jgi:hypothetical protein